MKSIIDKKEKQTFPKLMKNIDTGCMVLFTSEISGTVVNEDVPFYGIGHYSDGWGIASFTDFTGTITLSND